jgi:DNA-binding transcriptional ArsR family regulator
VGYAYALDALGDPTRRAILEQLRPGARAVGEIARELPVSRPAVSKHLKVLAAAGLVRERRVGTRHLYQLDPVALAELRDELERFWMDALASLQESARRGEPA